MLRVHGLKTKLVYIENNDQKTAEKFRANLKKNLTESKKFVAVNFDGKVLGKTTRGHISPVVAYDQETDSVLILDVALHKNQWYWADLSKLVEAMNSKDGDTYRGYLVVSR